MLTPPFAFAPPSISIAISALHHDHDKLPTGHLYLCQPRTFEVIQLVEGPPPPPRQISSVISSSAASSSSCSVEYDDSYPDDDDDGSVCESYCSSDQLSEDDPALNDDDPQMPSLDDTYSSRMKRVFAWREHFTKAMGITPPDPPDTPIRKRKGDDHDDNPTDEEVLPKRLRSDSGDSDSASSTSSSSSSSSSHSCPACDASFPSRHSLLLHGRAVGASESCCVAVEYDFE